MGLFRKRKSRATRRAEARALKSRRQTRGAAGRQGRGETLQGHPARGRPRTESPDQVGPQPRPRRAQGRRKPTQSRPRRPDPLARPRPPDAGGDQNAGACHRAAGVPGRDGCARPDRRAARRPARGAGGSHRRVLRTRKNTARLSARIAGAEKTLRLVQDRKPKDSETKQFVSAITERLSDLSTAVTAIETMPGDRRRVASASISDQLDGIDADLMARLGLPS